MRAAAAGRCRSTSSSVACDNVIYALGAGQPDRRPRHSGLTLDAPASSLPTGRPGHQPARRLRRRRHRHRRRHRDPGRWAGQHAPRRPSTHWLRGRRAGGRRRRCRWPRPTPPIPPTRPALPPRTDGPEHHAVPPVASARWPTTAKAPSAAPARPCNKRCEGSRQAERGFALPLRPLPSMRRRAAALMPRQAGHARQRRAAPCAWPSRSARRPRFYQRAAADGSDPRCASCSAASP